MRKAIRNRTPKLRFTSNRGIGWHVVFREKVTNSPRRHRFGISDREREPEARLLYHAWMHEHLGGQSLNGESKDQHRAPKGPPPPDPSGAEALSGSLLEIASMLVDNERERVRGDYEPRRRGTVHARVFMGRKKQVYDFLGFLNERHGPGAVSRLRLADLTMEDVETYNRRIVKDGLSASQVAKRMQVVKTIIDRAGRPEFGRQVLSWNWDSRDRAHGLPPKERLLPTVKQLQKLLAATDLRGKTWIWLGIGLGLGPKDLAVIRVGQITKESYDLRRAKTGVERYGETPPLVWTFVKKYRAAARRATGQLLFVTRNGEPLVHGLTNAVTLWWERLRAAIDADKTTLSGFYTLRHLGATEFGSRPGASIGALKRWLGHTASSEMADLYMRPVKPEYREVVRWVRKQLMQRK